MLSENRFDSIIEKVINEAIAYHGSPRSFNNFSIDTKTAPMATGNIFGSGIYVTTKEKEAFGYAMNSKGFIYTVEIPDDNGRNYLNIGERLNNGIKYRIAKYITPYVAKKSGKSAFNFFMDIMFSEKFQDIQSLIFCTDRQAIPILNKSLAEMGYIGLKVPQYKDECWYIIFYPNNVKIIDRNSRLDRTKVLFPKMRIFDDD